MTHQNCALDGVRLHRALPLLRDPEDSVAFVAETERELPPVATQTVTGDFLPDGWHGDLGGLRGTVKKVLVRATTSLEGFLPRGGRVPLVATDRFSNGYFHWVTETLPRLWWLRDRLADRELLLPAFAARFAYMTESLAAFPTLLSRTLPPRTRWHLIDAEWVPATAPTGNYRPDLMRGLAALLREQVGNPKPFRKLYISRARAARRRIANEAALTPVLEAQGFERVFLEGRPFFEQVRLLAETSHLLSNHGAGLTNMLFMQTGMKVTEVRLRGDYHNNCYFSLARALELDYDYRLADAGRAGEPAHTADLIVDPQEFS